MNGSNDNEQMIYCPRCGSEMKSSARYCMKCGNLNYDHEANKSMKEIMGDQVNEITSYQMGAGGVVSNLPVKGVKTALATNTGSDLFCFLINYLLYIVLLAAIIVPQVLEGFSFKTLTSFSIAIPVTIVSIYFLYCYSIELIFMKCNKRWWASFIPIYNLFIFSNVTLGRSVYAIFYFVPILGQVLFLLSLYKLGRKFNYNGILTMLFPIFVIPHIALSVNLYDNTMYVPSGKNVTEVFYGRRKVFAVTCFLFFLLSFSSYIYNNREEIKEYKRLATNYYYVYTAHRLVHKVRVKLDHNFYSCKTTKEFSSSLGDYYFYMPDVGKHLFIPFYYSHDAITGYVRVNYTKDGYTFYVSLSDGTVGFPEKEINELSVKDVNEYKEVDKSFLDEEIRNCQFGT